MSGCWLALDEHSHVRLCSELPLEGLSEAGFVHWMQGFVHQTHEIPGLLRVHTAAAPVRRSV